MNYNYSITVASIINIVKRVIFTAAII